MNGDKNPTLFIYIRVGTIGATKDGENTPNLDLTGFVGTEILNCLTKSNEWEEVKISWCFLEGETVLEQLRNETWTFSGHNYLSSWANKFQHKRRLRLDDQLIA